MRPKRCSTRSASIGTVAEVCLFGVGRVAQPTLQTFSSDSADGKEVFARLAASFAIRLRMATRAGFVAPSSP